jgi:hypothetical protein
LENQINTLVIDSVEAFTNPCLCHDETLWKSFSNVAIDNIRAHFSMDAAYAVLRRAIL